MLSVTGEKEKVPNSGRLVSRLRVQETVVSSEFLVSPFCVLVAFKSRLRSSSTISDCFSNFVSQAALLGTHEPLAQWSGSGSGTGVEGF